MTLKRCPRCCECLPRSAFGARPNGYVQGYCHPCQIAIGRERNARISAERAQKRQRELESRHSLGKACLSCGELKPLGAFEKHAECIDGHVNHCKACWRDRRKKASSNYRARNPERVRESMRAWAENHPEKVKANRIATRARQIASLSDGYVKRLLTERAGGAIAASMIPDSLVAIKREHLQMIRLRSIVGEALAAEHEANPTPRRAPVDPEEKRQRVNARYSARYAADPEKERERSRRYKARKRAEKKQEAESAGHQAGATIRGTDE